MNRLLSLIETRSGTQLKDTRLTRVEAFIAAQTDAGMSAGKLEQILSTSDFSHPTWQALIQQISVGETYFFRNEGHFNALTQHVFPSLIRERRRLGQRYLRVWVAGCATGEEAYSLAMLLHDLLPDLAEWSIFLLATDINLTFLEFARRGLYRPRAFRRETRSDIQGRFFTETDEGYLIDPHIRQMVTFTPLNLTEQVYPSLANNTTSLDLILCRNVTIYFDKPTTQKIINRFYGALRPEGWLLVGHAEPQPKVYDAFTTHNWNRAIVYQKPQPTLEPIAPTPPVTPSQPITTSLPVMPTPPKTPQRDVTPPPEAPAPIKEVTPPPLDTLLETAQAAADDEAWDVALDVLAKADLLDRFHPQIHYLRGLVYTHLDETHAAVQAYRQAVYCEPIFPLAHYALGELLLQIEQRQAAVASLKRARKLLVGQAPDGVVLGADDLTTGMLLELVDHRLKQETDNHV